MASSPAHAAAAAIRRIGTQRDILGECPLWSAAEQALYWVDIRQPAIRRLDHRSGEVRSWPLPELVGSIALAGPGRLLVALGQGLSMFDTAGGTLSPIARLQAPVEGHRFNDGRCDPRGRFWVGTMHNLTRAPEGSLYRFDGAAGLVEQRSAICIPNSLAWSPDGGTMYFADSLRHTIFAHDYDLSRGQMGAPRVFATTAPPAFPDGSTVDAEGCLWNAEFHGSRLVRYASDGRVDRVLELPVTRPTCCAFGGPGLATLYITTTSQRMSADELAAQPLAGALLAVDVGVCGLPEPQFALHPASPTEESRT